MMCKFYTNIDVTKYTELKQDTGSCLRIQLGISLLRAPLRRSVNVLRRSTNRNYVASVCSSFSCISWVNILFDIFS